MESQHTSQRTRRQALGGFGLMLAGLLLASCAPQEPPAPGSWAEEYQRRKEKYRQWGEGHDSKSQ
jgi:hypothetical protein